MDILFGMDQHLIAIPLEMKYFYSISAMSMVLLEYATMDESLEEAWESQMNIILHSWMSTLPLKWKARLWSVFTKVAVQQK